MNSQTLQTLRAEVEAVVTLQLALNRLALSVDENSLSMWDGPRPEDVDDVAADDGSFTREAVQELRNKAGAAIAARYREVERVITGRAALENILRDVLATGTGGVLAANHDGPTPDLVLQALARSGALRLDWAQAAAVEVRDALAARGPGVKPKAPVKAAAKKPAAKKKARKVAAKKAPARAAKKKAPAKKPARKVAAKKAPAKKPARRKK